MENLDEIKALRDKCVSMNIKRKNNTNNRTFNLLCKSMRNFDVEFIIDKDILSDENYVFVCNHSNSHDFFIANEMLYNLDKSGSVFVASDCLNNFNRKFFNFFDATMIDRNSKSSSLNGLLEISNKLLNGKSAVVFAESTWNIHPTLLMQNIKIGPLKMAMISDKKIVPVIFEYVEEPELVTKEKDLYKKCIIYVGKPITVDLNKNIVEQTNEIKNTMSLMRKELKEQNNVFYECLKYVDPLRYVNHTYVKKFCAFGFEFDSEYENKFIYMPKGIDVENEHTLSENGLLVPGITLKRKL